MTHHVFNGKNPDARTEARRLLDVWVREESLAKLVAAFDATVPQAPLGETLRWLASFSDRWDFRKGKERTGIGEAALPRAANAAVAEAAARLGLSEAAPPTEGAYTYIVVPGGTLLACVLRVRLARSLLDHVATERVYLLGTGRVPAPVERDVLVAAGETLPIAEDEYAMLRLLAEREFGATPSGSEIRQAHGACQQYTRTRRPSINVLSTKAAGRRATTGDTYVHLNEDAKLKKGDSLLICTTQIYAPFQFFDAVRLLALPYGVRVEVVGFTMPQGAPLQRPENYLQELRSSILSAQRLLHDLESESSKE